MAANHENWRNAHPGLPAVRASSLARFLELGNKLINSWWVLAPLGVMCVWAVLYSAGAFGK